MKCIIVFFLSMLFCFDAYANQIGASRINPRSSGVPYSGGSFSGDVHLQDDVALEWGNTDAAPDYWCQYNSSATQWECVSTDSDGGGTDLVFMSIDDGTAIVDFKSSISINDVLFADENNLWCAAPVSDVAPDTLQVAGGDAYSAATGGNQSGAPLYIRGGFGSYLITIDDWNNCAGDNVAVIINGVTNTLTEGVDWVAGTDNATTAISLAAAADALSISASASASTVEIIIGQNINEFNLTESDATCTTLTEGASGDVRLAGRGNARTAFDLMGNLLTVDKEQSGYYAGIDGCAGVGTLLCLNYGTTAGQVAMKVEADGDLDIKKVAYNSGGVLEMGGAMVSTHSLGATDVGFVKDIEVDGTSYLDGSTILGENLYFGTKTVADPMIKKFGSSMAARTGDDANYTGWFASVFTTQVGGWFSFSTRSEIRSLVDGDIQLTNDANTDFGSLYLGTVDASGVRIRKSGTSILIERGDGVNANVSMGSLTLGSASILQYAGRSRITSPANGWTLRTDQTAANGICESFAVSGALSLYDMDCVSDAVLNVETINAGTITLNSGTNSPAIQIFAENVSGEVFIMDRYADSTGAVNYLAQKARGTKVAPTAVLANDNVFALRAAAYDGSTFDIIGYQRFEVQSIAAGNIGGRWSLYTSDSTGGTQQAILVDQTQSTYFYGNVYADTTGSSVNGKKIYSSGDNAGNQVQSYFYTAYGAQPYMIIGVSDDGTTPADTDVLHIDDNSIRPASDLLLDVGSTSNRVNNTYTKTIVVSGVEGAAPTEPYACSNTTVGAIVYVDDTDDGVPSYYCVCLDMDDGSTFDWRSQYDPINTACTAF